jgi:hypothetical protein
MLYDNEPNKIQKEITNRDVFGVSDHFSVSINGFNDGQQDFRFFVSAANIQMDCLQKGTKIFPGMRYGKAKPLSPILDGLLK